MALLARLGRSRSRYMFEGLHRACFATGDSRPGSNPPQGNPTQRNPGQQNPGTNRQESASPQKPFAASQSAGNSGKDVEEVDDEEEDWDYDDDEEEGTGDIVTDTFVQQQRAFREVLDGLQNISYPTDLENQTPETFKKFAHDVEALKKEAGLITWTQAMEGQVAYQFNCAQGDMREFIQSLVSFYEIENEDDVQEFTGQLYKIVDEVEAKHGPIKNKDSNAFKAFQDAVQKFGEQNDLLDDEAIEEEANTLLYTTQVHKSIEQSAEEIEALKKREGLEDINLDITKIKPSSDESGGFQGIDTTKVSHA